MVTGQDERARSGSGRRWRRFVAAAAVGVLAPLAVPAAASAATPCTPDGFWATCTQFDYTGADQTYTVPAGVSFIEVKVWGAAGAPGADPSSGAGFSTGTVPVIPGQQLTVTVGQGGVRNSTAPTYGGGGAGGSGERDAGPDTPSWTIGGSGGGLSAVWAGPSGTQPLLVAGGSGGGAPTRNGVPGGTGGGATGGSAPDGSGASGGGGTAGAGGGAGNNTVCATTGVAGTAFTGGAGSSGFDGGSGGGGGYFGGGGGSCQQAEGDDNNEGAGGGGSGFVDTALVPDGTTAAGTGTTAAGSTDVHYVAGVGSSAGDTVGGNGLVVIQAEAPAPTAQPVTSTGGPGETQQVTVTPPAGGAVYLRNAANALGTSTTNAAGSYTVVPETGVITFTPAAGFSGTAPAVTYALVDITDRRSESTYTVTVALPPAPAPADASTTGAVGTAQTLAVPVPPGGQLRLLDAAGAPATTVEVTGEGSYRIGADGASVVFTPDARFAGQTVGVRFAVADQYGQTGTARYAPVVTPPAAPVAGALTSTGPAGAVQSVVVPVPDGGTVTLLDAQGAAVTTVGLAGQGTYALDPATGALTFTPAAGFSGTADAVTYVVSDAFGQSSTGTYAATVTAAVTAPGDDPGDGPGSGAGRLSETGADVGGLGALAAMWLVAGAGLLLVRSRHRGQPA